MVAGQLRLLDSIKLDRLLPLELSPILTGRLVHATSDRDSFRVKSASLSDSELRVGRERPATLRMDADVTGSVCQCMVQPPPFICKTRNLNIMMGKHPASESVS